MNVIEKPPLDGVYLAHFGVKGMKWGVRKDRSTSSSSEKNSSVSRLTPKQKSHFKKVAIGFGTLSAAGGAVYITRKLNGRSGSLPVSRIRSSASVKETVTKSFQEPTSVLHATRGKNHGFQFLKSGGTPEPFKAWEAAGFDPNGAGGERFTRLADGKVAASFYDPLGRTDRAGRVIPHDVVVPKSMSDGLSSLDDVKSKIWPSLAPDYDVLYNLPPGSRTNAGG